METMEDEKTRKAREKQRKKRAKQRASQTPEKKATNKGRKYKEQSSG